MYGLNLKSTPFVGSKTLVQRALSILRRPGIEAHVYLPGIGTLSGLAAANYLDSALTTPATVDNPVGGAVDAIGVINATQPTTAAKPRLERGVRNLLTWSSDLSNAAWGKSSLTITGSAPMWTATTLALTHNLTNGTGGTAGVTVTASTNYTFAFYAKSGTMTDVKYSVYNITGAANIIAPTSYISQINGSTDTLIVVNFTTPVGCTQVNCFMVRDSGVTGTTFVGATGLFQGTLTAAQILNEGGIPLTTTAAASNPASGKYSWAFDGGDSLALGSVPFQMSDDFAIVGSVNTDASGTRTIFSLASTVSGNPLISFDLTAGIPRLACRDDANVLSVATGGASFANQPIVMSGRKVGNTKVSRVNGSQTGTDATALGASTFTGAAIGVRPVSVPTGFLIGSTGLILAIKGTLTDSETLTLERLVSNLTPNAPSF